MGRNRGRGDRYKIGSSRPGTGDLSTLPAHGPGPAALQSDRRAHHRRRAFYPAAKHPQCYDGTRCRLPIRPLEPSDTTILRANSGTAIVRGKLTLVALLRLRPAAVRIQ